MELQVDYRERAVLGAFAAAAAVAAAGAAPTHAATYVVKGKSYPLPVSTATLHVADFHLVRDGKPVLLIERKTVADLAASISTGRYREQKARLLHTAATDGCKVVYLVEGPMDGSTLFLGRGTGAAAAGAGAGTSPEMMRKLLVRATIKDGCFVVNTMSAAETATILTYMAALVHEFGSAAVTVAAATAAAGESNYPALVRTEKKANMTPPVIQQCMLRVVPGVSDKLAQVLLSRFGGLLGLVEALKADRTAAATVEYEVAAGKKRKIGPALGGRIAEALLLSGGGA
jgi:ERCC4-type nuclease